MRLKKFNRLNLGLAVVFTCLFTLFSCNSCVEVQHQKHGFDRYKNHFSSPERAEKALTEHIAARTVRVIVRCKIVNILDGKAPTGYKDSGWGTGAIVASTSKYSLIQTAHHVVVNKVKQKGFLLKICDKFAVEQKDVNNVVIGTYRGKVTVVAKDKEADLAVIRVEKNYGVSTALARSIHLGQSVRVIGYPYLRGIKGKHLSYEKGYVATRNLGEGNGWIKHQMRIGTAGYFGNSGGAVWNQRGELVGTVVSLIGYRTLGGYVPQQNCLYGPGIKALRAFYRKHKKVSIVLQE